MVIGTRGRNSPGVPAVIRAGLAVVGAGLLIAAGVIAVLHLRGSGARPPAGNAAVATEPGSSAGSLTAAAAVTATPAPPGRRRPPGRGHQDPLGAATSLWYEVGGASGIRSFNSAAELADTTPSPCVNCAGFPWPGWGLTTTVPGDQLTLLRALVEPNRLLTDAERSYALSLMENVTPDQRWGVSGGVPAQATVALKNGWLPLNSADSDWQINSVGWISGSGRDYLMAVLTTGNSTEQYGIDTIDQLSAMVWNGMG